MIRKLEDIAMEAVQNETHKRKKDTEKYKQNMVRCGTTSRGPIYTVPESEGRVRQKKYFKT